MVEMTEMLNSIALLRVYRGVMIKNNPKDVPKLLLQYRKIPRLFCPILYAHL